MGNSTSFKAGRSGNPGGRTKGLEKQIRELVASFKAKDCNGKEIDGWTAIVERLYRTAIGEVNKANSSDEVSAAKLLYERAYGKPHESVDVGIGTSPEQLAILEALKLTPLQRKARAAEIAEGGDDLDAPEPDEPG